MLTLHHLETSRSQRVLWLLEELGVPYEMVTWQRDARTRLAPAGLKKIHPMGKSPVLVDGDVVVAESGAILEYLAQRHRPRSGELAGLLPLAGDADWLPCRYWMHFAEGSLMNWLVMQLVFTVIPTRPMPFFVRPVARALCGQVRSSLIEPNVHEALALMDAELAGRTWFAGERLTVADFQMSFAVEAALTRVAAPGTLPHLRAWRERMAARPAWQRAIAKGGPVVMGA
jgi:glutathione S-transferase